MSDTRLLIGSLSNDLFRVAALVGRGSPGDATVFLLEAKRWAKSLRGLATADYIQNISKDIETTKVGPVSPALAEKFLMYGVILQNYALHNQ